MDVNGTRFQLLLGRDDWSRCTDGSGRALARAWRDGVLTNVAEVDWIDEREEVTLRGLTPHVVSAPADFPPKPSDRRGAARDRFGNWYWVDESRTALRVGASRKPSSHFWAAEDELAPQTPRSGDFTFAEPPQLPPLTFGGLAVTSDHYLVAGLLDPAGLAVFDLLAGGGPVRFIWAGPLPFAPVDLAARPDGGVVVLDQKRYWLLDRLLDVERIHVRAAHGPRTDFSSAEATRPGPRTLSAADVVAEDAVSLSGDPIAIEAAADGSILVLDGHGASITRYVDGTRNGPIVALHHDAYDFALAGSSLYVMATSGNQVYEHRLTYGHGRLAAPLARAFYPVRGFAGKAIVGAGDVAYYDFGDTWLPIVEQRRRRYLTEGAIVSPPLDGRQPGCVWHRLLVDACLPPGTSLSVSTRTSEDPDGLATATWRTEPVPVVRSTGTELPFLVGDDRYETWELLFQAAAGRYLQIRLELAGDGRASPRVRSLRAYFPRFSYLEHYLPAVYREDDVSASFLDRFLANPEGTLSDLEGRMATVQALFDPRTAPPETLDWLARWFDVALDPAWNESRRRLFIANAMRFFAMRGTVRGVELALRLALDDCVDESLFQIDAPTGGARRVTIVEWFRRRTGGGTELDEATNEAGIRVNDRLTTWRPSIGAVDLHARFAAFVDPQRTQPAGAILYPLKRPRDADASLAWTSFSQQALGFVPSSSARDTPAWQDFLARKYRRPSALATAYGATRHSLRDWDELRLPAHLPAGLAALSDWFHFERVILPLRRYAHRFTVLLPVKPPAHPDDHEAVARNQVLSGLAKRIVELEKPAHTVFDIRFFWAVFRLGDARLGRDTIAELGTRGLGFRPAVVGREHVGETVLSNGLPADLAARAASSAVGSIPQRSAP